MTTARDHEAVQLLEELIPIQSVTPWLIPGGAGEMAVAERMAEYLAGTPIEVEIEEVEPGRPNLLARLRGTGGGPTLCLNAHSDTVGFAAWPDRALRPEVRGDRMYGLGSCDDKGSCAALLWTIRSLASSGHRLRGDLLVACVADEEGASIGTEHLVANHRFDAAIVVEPQSNTDIVVEHQGFGWIDVTSLGKPAHGNAAGDGVDAIVNLARVIEGLHELDAREFSRTAGSTSGRTVFHTGIVSGGTDYATYPSRATVGIEIGTQPGEHLSDRVREIEEIFAAVTRRDPSFRGEIDVRIDRDPFSARGHEALLAAVDGAWTEVRGAAPARVGMNGWADSGLVQGAGIPTLLAGPLGENLHVPDEWVSMPELAEFCDLMLQTSIRYLA